MKKVFLLCNLICKAILRWSIKNWFADFKKIRKKFTVKYSKLIANSNLQFLISNPGSVRTWIREAMLMFITFQKTKENQKKLQLQSNLYKTSTLGTTQKWSYWTGGRLIKHLHKMTTAKCGSFEQVFRVFFPRYYLVE